MRPFTPSTLSLFLALCMACTYDYGALQGGRVDGGRDAAGTGTGTGGSMAVVQGSGGQSGPSSGASGGVAGGLGSGGSAGTTASISTGGASATTDGGIVGAGGLTGTGGRATSADTGGNSAGGRIGGGGTAGGGVDNRGGVSGRMGMAVGGAGGAVTRILSIDFVGGKPVGTSDTVTDLPAMKATDVAGIKQAARWNAAAGPMGSLPALTLADGTVTTASVTWNSPPGASGPGTWWCGFNDVPGDVRMMNGYLDPLSTTTPQVPATVVVANLPVTITSSGYDVYVYAQGAISAGAVRTAAYSIATATFTVTATGPSPATFTGYRLVPQPAGAGNYVVFRNVTGPSFTLLAAPGPTGRAPVNGIQIVSPTGL